MFVWLEEWVVFGDGGGESWLAEEEGEEGSEAGAAEVSEGADFGGGGIEDGLEEEDGEEEDQAEPGFRLAAFAPVAPGDDGDRSEQTHDAGRGTDDELVDAAEVIDEGDEGHAADAGTEVDGEEAPLAHNTDDVHAEDVEAEHVDPEVHKALMEEGGGEGAPPFAGDDEGGDEGAEALEGDGVEAAAEDGGEQEHGDIDADEELEDAGGAGFGAELDGFGDLVVEHALEVAQVLPVVGSEAAAGLGDRSHHAVGDGGLLEGVGEEVLLGEEVAGGEVGAGCLVGDGEPVLFFVPGDVVEGTLDEHGDEVGAAAEGEHGEARELLVVAIVGGDLFQKLGMGLNHGSEVATFAEAAQVANPEEGQGTLVRREFFFEPMAGAIPVGGEGVAPPGSDDSDAIFGLFTAQGSELPAGLREAAVLGVGEGFPDFLHLLKLPSLGMHPHESRELDDEVLVALLEDESAELSLDVNGEPDHDEVDGKAEVAGIVWHGEEAGGGGGSDAEVQRHPLLECFVAAYQGLQQCHGGDAKHEPDQQVIQIHLDFFRGRR